ncbi:hypothetical protein [Achromobacter phage SE2]|nr:hypothetical protein [Achromobacter phage SE2]
MDKSISAWFTQSTPNPTSTNRSTQIGCHFEEVSEMVESLTGTSHLASLRLKEVREALHNLAELCKTDPGAVVVMDKDRLDFADSLCDQVVTAIGSGVFYKIDMLGAVNEVNDSNWSKFVNGQPVRDPSTQKIMKGPDYFKPDLSKFV